MTKSKFLLTENPMNPEADGHGILHTEFPKIHFKVFADIEELSKAMEGGQYQHYIEIKYPNPDGIIELYYLWAEDLFELLRYKEELLYDTFVAAGEWYKQYLKWEDNQVDSIHPNPSIINNKIYEH